MDSRVIKQVLLHLGGLFLFVGISLSIAKITSIYLEQSDGVRYYTFFTLLGIVFYGIYILLRGIESAIDVEKAEIGIPGGGKLSVSLSRRRREVAWVIFIEIMTRVGANELPLDRGVSKSAMDSMYELFKIIRSLAAEAGPTRKVPKGGDSLEVISIRFLNHKFRPFLTKWHGRKIDSDGNYCDNDSEFRDDLNRMNSEILNSYAIAYAKLAGVKNATGLVERCRVPSFDSESEEDQS